MVCMKREKVGQRDSEALRALCFLSEAWWVSSFYFFTQTVYGWHALFHNTLPTWHRYFSHRCANERQPTIKGQVRNIQDNQVWPILHESRQRASEFTALQPCPSRPAHSHHLISAWEFFSLCVTLSAKQIMNPAHGGAASSRSAWTAQGLS